MPSHTDRIEKRIELHAPVSRVWRAITDYREFGVWLRVKLDQPFVVGQVSRGQITYPGQEPPKGGAFVKGMEPGHTFSFRGPPPKSLKEGTPPVDFSVEP